MLHEAIFPSTCNATMTNEKHCKLRWTCYTQQHVSQRCEKVEVRFTFLATCNATFCFIASCGNGVKHGQLFSQLAMQRLFRCKLQEKLPRVTWPCMGSQRDWFPFFYFSLCPRIIHINQIRKPLHAVHSFTPCLLTVRLMKKFFIFGPEKNKNIF